MKPRKDKPSVFDQRYKVKELGRGYASIVMRESGFYICGRGTQAEAEIKFLCDRIAQLETVVMAMKAMRKRKGGRRGK